MNFFLVMIAVTLSLCSTAWASQDILTYNPPQARINEAVSLVLEEYRKDVFAALKKAGRNRGELITALEKTDPSRREGMAFLIANMPAIDLMVLKASFLMENNQLAYQAREEMSWGKSIPQDIFLNDVLPYATLNERRDNWRRDFYTRFKDIAVKSNSIDEAVLTLNKYVFETLKVSYHASKRPKPDQSPYESIEAHYASCTGLSVLLTDALRAVGIPARIVGTPLWSDESGNHTWVEIWNGQWRYIGAAESTGLDKAWFTDKAAQASSQYPIYATSFKQTGIYFPMRWAPHLRFVPAIEVTGDYN